MTAPSPTLTVVVMSHRPEVREAIASAVGRRPAPDLPRLRFVEAATVAEVLGAADAGEIDLAVLDGEAQPTGGMGLARQFKYEITDCPPVVVLIARRQDGWLASWSLADAVINTPIDPVESASVVAEQLRRRHTGIPVVR
jgi:DNA-binding response OmpR family regulator